MKNYYEIRGDVTEIYLTKYGLKTLIDTVNLEKVLSYGNVNWIANMNRNIKQTYVIGCKNYKQVKLHRLITDAPAGMVVDHINHDTLDNRVCNLRVVTSAENSKNKGKYVYEWHEALKKSVKEVNKMDNKKKIKAESDKRVPTKEFHFSKTEDKRVTKKFVALVSNGKVVYQNKTNLKGRAK